MIILFDLGKVILNFDLTIISSKLAALSENSEADIAYYIFENGLSRAFERGNLNPEEFFEAVRKQLNLTISFERFAPIWNEIFTPLPGMEQLVNILKATHRVGLLSNTNKLHFEYVANTYPVVQGMDWHLSYKMHTAKPDPEIYNKVIQFYNINPKEIFFTDDIARNVEGAINAGMQAVQFHSVGQLKEELAHRGIPA